MLKDKILRSEGDKTRAQKKKMEDLKKSLDERKTDKRRVGKMSRATKLPGLLLQLALNIRKARENAEKALKEAKQLRKDIDALEKEEEERRPESEKLGELRSADPTGFYSDCKSLPWDCSRIIISYWSSGKNTRRRWKR